jgi:hypothetical protein
MKMLATGMLLWTMFTSDRSTVDRLPKPLRNSNLRVKMAIAGHGIVLHHREEQEYVTANHHPTQRLGLAVVWW